MTEMTMKEALELAIFACDYLADNPGRIPHDESEKIGMAAAMLRDGGPVVEKEHIGCRCNWCSRWFVDEYDYISHTCGMTDSMRNQKLITKKKWTEREKLQIVPEKSKPTFEEITDGKAD